MVSSEDSFIDVSVHLKAFKEQSHEPVIKSFFFFRYIRALTASLNLSTTYIFDP